MTHEPPKFLGVPMRAADTGAYYLVSRQGTAITVYRLSTWWRPWRGTVAIGGGTLHARAWTAQGVTDKLAAKFSAWCRDTVRLAADIGLVPAAARTPACDLCARPATLTTTGPHPEDARRTLCTHCAVDVEYVHIVAGGSPLVWEYVTPGSAT